MPLRLSKPSNPKLWPKPRPRPHLVAGLGRLRKIALLGGSLTLAYAPWHDTTWELWSHASCREK